jgi:hypothetical protein
VEQDVHGNTRLREQEPPKRPSTTPGPAAGDGDRPQRELSEQAQMLVRVLQRNFPSMIHAFTLFDADDGNEVGLMEVRHAVQWLYKREKGKELGDEKALADFDARAFIQELSLSKLAGRGATLTLNDFVRNIRFGDNLEDWKQKLEAAREWRNNLLAEESFQEKLYVTSLGTGFLDELKAKMQEKFDNAAEAFVFFDRGCCGFLTENEWKIGIRRLGLMLNVNHLMMVLDGDGGTSDGRIDEEEFTKTFAWHSLKKWDKMMQEAKKFRKKVSNRITMELFKERELMERSQRLPPVGSASRTISEMSESSKFCKASLASSTLIVGNITFDGRGRRGAAQWQMQFVARIAECVDPPANPDRFLFVGFQDGDIVLAIMPDASDWEREPKHVAMALQESLARPDNPLREWDPSVRGATKTFLMKNQKWNFNTQATKGLFDEAMTNNLLMERARKKREHVVFPRSDVGFKALGALDHWRCIDGVGKVGHVNLSLLKQRDKGFPLSLLQHRESGLFLELLHFSPGFFLFQVKGGKVLCCSQDGRVRERSDFAHKGDGKGPAWKFHSPTTVAKFKVGDGPTGLRWEFTGTAKPAHGRELHNVGLAAALAHRTELTQQEWDGFGIEDLRHDDFVKSGNSYFTALDGQVSAIAVALVSTTPVLENS